MNIACSIRAARRFQPSHRAVFSGCSWLGNATKRPTWPGAEPDGNPSAPCHATYAPAYGERSPCLSSREIVLVRYHQAHRSCLRRICRLRRVRRALTVSACNILELSRDLLSAIALAKAEGLAESGFALPVTAQTSPVDTNLKRLHIAMSDKIRSYAELRELIRLSLRAQHPEWVEPNGDSPICDSYEAKFVELLALTRSWQNAKTSV
jgi:hypothetical protein